MPVAILLRRVFVLTVVTVTVLALPADASALKLFRSPDHRVVCTISHVISLMPAAGCRSHATLNRRPEAPENGCGSGRSAALATVRGRTVLYEICIPLWLPGTPIRTLKVHDKVTSRYFKCSALSMKTIRCASKLTGHGFKVSRTTFVRF